MVKLSALFRKKGSINLLPKDEFDSGTVGKILEWALAFGKWTVIITQLVVVGAFVFRFGLDRKLTNLRRDIQKEVAVIKSYEALENDFRLAQDQLKFIGPIAEKQQEMVSIIDDVSAKTPIDVWYDRLTITRSEISLTAYSSSIAGFSAFLGSFQRDQKYTKLNVGNLQSGAAENARLQFTATATYDEKAVDGK